MFALLMIIYIYIYIKAAHNEPSHLDIHYLFVYIYKQTNSVYPDEMAHYEPLFL